MPSGGFGTDGAEGSCAAPAVVTLTQSAARNRERLERRMGDPPRIRRVTVPGAPHTVGDAELLRRLKRVMLQR
jgi:hypothetical protein